MINADFGKVFFDLRDGRMRNLEIRRKNCFAEDLNLWYKKNEIHGTVEVPKKDVNFENNSVVYMLA